ncbi:MAG: glutamine synthetase, partial [Lachnospiraceae bacterium]|nr:glutamine synthetase [Lachnospiraceae bacterium]
CYEDGTPFELSSRYILKNALKAASEKGYRALVDPECEFFLFHTDENGLPTTQSHEQAGYLDVGPVDFGENARRDIVLMLEEMGFEIESSHHEHAPAQHEVDFKEEEAMRTADNIETFRFAVRSIAKRFGLYATFMPKPKADVAGSGMHTNINIFKNNRSIFRNEDGSATDDAYYFIGGILKHAKALCAIANPIVNSYKRLILGTDEINKITWAEKGEKSLVKLLKTMDEIKVELRFPDGASNPYLLLATCIAAGVDGIENKINPGKDINSAGKDAVFENLPENLRDAIDELNKDELIKGVLGEEFVNIYSKIKINEWKDYMKEVSDWEINTYLTRM